MFTPFKEEGGANQSIFGKKFTKHILRSKRKNFSFLIMVEGWNQKTDNMMTSFIGATKKGPRGALGTPNKEQNGANKEQNLGKKDLNGAFLGCCLS